MASITAAQFIDLLEAAGDGEAAPPTAEGDEWIGRYRIPTGPLDSVDLNDLDDLHLEVADSLDLRGRTLKRPIFVHGVRFRGRVDLRDLRVEGSADFTGCVFDEELRIDDAEIGGSLRLTRISTERLTLNGVIIRGRLDLSGSQSRQPISMFDAEVDGFVDLRGIDSEEVRLKGSHIRSDLRMGCATDGGGPSALRTVDARGCRILGHVAIDGAGSGQPRCVAEMREAVDRQALQAGFCWPEPGTFGLTGLSVDLSGAEIGGNVQSMAHHGQNAPYDMARERRFASVKAATPVIWPVLGRLNLTGARVRGHVLIIGTLVEDGLDATDVRVGGDLRLEPGELIVPDGKQAHDWISRQTEMRPTTRGLAGIDARGAHVVGRVSIVGVRVRGLFDLSGARFGSHLDIRGHVVREPYRPAQDDDGPARPCGLVVPTSMEGDLRMYLCRFGGAVEMHGIQVQENLSLWAIDSTAFVRLTPFLTWPCTVGGEIDLHSARLLQFEAEGALIGGRVRLDGCEMLHFVARPGRLKLPEGVRPAEARPGGATSTWTTGDSIVLSEFGHLVMRNGRLRGDMKLHFLQVTGREADGERGLVIEDSQIAGSLTLFGEHAIVRLYLDDLDSYADARRHCPIDYRNFGASVMGKLCVKRTTIGGAVELSAVKVDGPIDFEDSALGGDLRLAAVLPAAATPAWNPAVCHAMNIRMAKCTNDVDLTGLVVVAPEGGSAQDARVDAQYATVAGDLLCFDDNREGRRAFARIEGELNLSFAQLSHVVAAGCMLEPWLPSPVPRGERRGLVLERAKVGKLEIRESDDADLGPARSACQGPAAYPIPICLTDVSVEVWEVQGTAARGNDGERKYINLLANDKPFRRSTYRSLENSLRNGGDDEHADALYQAMKDREWREFVAAGRMHAGMATAGRFLGTLRFYVSNAPRAALHHAYRIFLRYGTSPMSLFGVVLFLFLLSLPAYRTPANFQASLAYLAVPVDRFPAGAAPRSHTSGPSAQEWQWADALQVALKNHVPIVPLLARDDWQPRDQGETAWSLDGGDCHPAAGPTRLTLCLPLAPEDAFNLVQLINWICWPILLTFSIRRLLKQA